MMRNQTGILIAGDGLQRFMDLLGTVGTTKSKSGYGMVGGLVRGSNMDSTLHSLSV